MTSLTLHPGVQSRIYDVHPGRQIRHHVCMTAGYHSSMLNTSIHHTKRVETLVLKVLIHVDETARVIKLEFSDTRGSIKNKRDEK